LWAGYELLDVKDDAEHSVATVKMLDSQTPNHLLSALLPHVELIGFREIVPSMNDIFIRTVEANV
jgi:ABC-2 type transport system ATP-binding protein